MKVSICIATYGNSEWETLAEERALPSAVVQGAHEVLMDHFPDGTIASARNELARRATGDWLCHLDADDQLAPGYLDAMRRAYGGQESLPGIPLLLTPAVQQMRAWRKVGQPFFFPECSFETGNWIVIGTLVPRDLFSKVGGFHEHPHGLEDWNLFARCVRAGAEIVKVPEAIYVAHWNQKSSHHVIRRNRVAYMQAYEVARQDAWG